MTDILTADLQSLVMAKIKKPKPALRSALHKKGLPYQLHRKELPSTPDLVFPLYNAVIFVHRCFWHGHDCHLFRWPYTRQNLWYEKITKNKLHDSEQQAIFSISGWRMAVIWCGRLKERQSLCGQM